MSKHPSPPADSAPLPSIRRNVAAMALVQVSNYLLPLLTVPYVTRVLGLEEYGRVVFAQALMAYCILLVDYGFSWSTARRISAHRHDRALISRTFAATLLAQWLLTLLAAVAVLLVVLGVERLRPDFWLYAAAFSSVLGSALLPLWLLQGLERLQAIAILQVASRLLAAVLVFALVSRPQDAVLLLLINGLATVLGGLAALWWIGRQRMLDWVWPDWQQVVGELREGASLFGSRLSISLYTTLVPLVLGWVAGPVALAQFNLADKLRQAAQSLITPLSQALFPRMTLLVATEDSSAFALLRRSFHLVLLIAGAASLSLWLLADWLIWLMGGTEFAAAAGVLRWMSPLPLLIGLSNLLGVQIMLPKGMNRSFNGVLLLAALSSLLLIWPLSSLYAAPGAALTVLLVEGLVTACMAVILWRCGLLRAHNWVTR